jgi:hypothetical protein
LPTGDTNVSGQEVEISGDGSTTANPYYLDTGGPGTAVVTVTVPDGYTVEHTLCIEGSLGILALYKSVSDGYYHMGNVSGTYGSWNECMANAIHYSGNSATIYACTGSWSLWWHFTLSATPTARTTTR